MVATKYQQIEPLPCLDFFDDFQQYGEYVPDSSLIRQDVRRRVGAEVESVLSEGYNGVVYNLSNEWVLKISTSPVEANIAKWLRRHPHPHVIKYRNIWRRGDLWMLIMERVETSEKISKTVNQYKNTIDDAKCHGPQEAYDLLSRPSFVRYPYIRETLSYLKHLSNMPITPFDFLNESNVGIIRGRIKFFDVN